MSSLLATSIAFGLPKEDSKLCKEFIENSEFGVALQWIADQLFEYDIKISKDFFQRFEMLANQMKVDKTTWFFFGKVDKRLTQVNWFHLGKVSDDRFRN